MIYALVMFSLFAVYHEERKEFHSIVHEPKIIADFKSEKDCRELEATLTRNMLQSGNYYACFPVKTWEERRK
jgi:hypothetical protein